MPISIDLLRSVFSDYLKVSLLVSVAFAGACGSEDAELNEAALENTESAQESTPGAETTDRGPVTHVPNAQGSQFGAAALPEGVEADLRAVEDRLRDVRPSGMGISSGDRERLDRLDRIPESAQAEMMRAALLRGARMGEDVSACDRIREVMETGARSAGVPPPTEEEVQAECSEMGPVAECFGPPEAMSSQRVRNFCRRLGRGHFIADSAADQEVEGEEGAEEEAPAPATMRIRRR